MIGADFVPSSFPPALRMRFFAQHLPEFGWDPVIVTTDPHWYECSVDPENERLLPPDLVVKRTAAFPARITRRLGIGDVGTRSLWHHWRAVRHLCSTERFDLVFIPVPPNPTMILGRLVLARFDIPYVIDYIDPVVTEYYWKLPRSQRPPKWALAYSIARILEPIALRRVSHLVGVDRSYLDDVLSRYSWLTDADVTSIPYGGSASDFDYLRSHPRKQSIFDPNDGLVHLSSVGRGGADLAPAISAFFHALRCGLERTPALFGKMRVHFVGTTYAAQGAPRHILAAAHAAGVGHLVDEHPKRISYLDATQVMLDSHGLVAFGSEERHYTASKIFPYILAQRPLLALFHEASSVVSIVKETGAGDVITFGDSEGLGNKVDVIRAWLENLLLRPRDWRPPTKWHAFDQYTTRAMASRLVQVFEHVLSVRRSTFRRTHERATPVHSN